MRYSATAHYHQISSNGGDSTPKSERITSLRFVPHQFRFADRWIINGTSEQVAEVFSDTHELWRWWPQLSKIPFASADKPNGVNRHFVYQARGFLPYRLSIEFNVTKVDYPHFFEVEISGDLFGMGQGHIKQVGSDVVVDFHSFICAGKRYLKILAWLAKPLLIAQHRWVMRQGEKGLSIEMKRRREAMISSL